LGGGGGSDGSEGRENFLGVAGGWLQREAMTKRERERETKRERWLNHLRRKSLKLQWND
jgi:hypothetical protein